MAPEPILVVDDNPTNLKLLRVLLEAEGYTVRTAQDGEQALAALRELRPRLVLMDLHLPGISGLELTRQLKADPATRDIPVLAVTASAREHDRQQALQAGCDGFLSKPIDTRALPGLVSRYLASCSPSN